MEARKRAAEESKVHHAEREAKQKAMEKARHYVHTKDGRVFQKHTMPPSATQKPEFDWDRQLELRDALLSAIKNNREPGPKDITKLGTRGLYHVLGWKSARGKLEEDLAYKVLALPFVQHFVRKATQRLNMAHAQQAHNRGQQHVGLDHGRTAVDHGRSRPDGELTKPVDAHGDLRNLQSLLTRLVRFADAGSKILARGGLVPREGENDLTTTIMGLDRVLHEVTFLDVQTARVVKAQSDRALQMRQELINLIIQKINSASHSQNLTRMQSTYAQCPECKNTAIVSARQRLQQMISILRRQPHHGRNGDEVR